MHNPMDIFDMFFGSSGPGKAKRQQTKVRDTVHQLTLSLEQLYNGCTKKLKVKRRILCTKCEGAGGGNVTKCSTCRGTGSEIFNQQIAPSLVQRIQRKCETCRGEGEIVKNPCISCKGKKRVIFLKQFLYFCYL